VSRLSSFRFLPLILLTAQIGDIQARETMLRFFGSDGGYALDCSRSTSPDNPHYVFADFRQDGQLAGISIYYRLKSQKKARAEDNTWKMNWRIVQVELQNGKEFLSYFMGMATEKYHYVWKKEGEEAIRLYQFEDILKHIEYVKDGVIPHTGIVTLAYHRCLRSMLAPSEEW
jgi:hypothetical protein